MYTYIYIYIYTYISIFTLRILQLLYECFKGKHLILCQKCVRHILHLFPAYKCPHSFALEASLYIYNIYIYKYLYTCFYLLSIYVSIYLSIYLSVYLSIYTYIHTFIHTYIHAYMHAYICRLLQTTCIPPQLKMDCP